MTFNDLVDLIRMERDVPDIFVPRFDPRNGNETARILFLFEAPGRAAILNGKISFDNEDDTARNFKSQLEEAGISRDDIAMWNIVPWYLGNDEVTKIRPAQLKNILEARKYLGLLVSPGCMPNLRCVMLVGGAARLAHIYLSHTISHRICSCYHTSPQAMNGRPDRWEENVDILRFINRTI